MITHLLGWIIFGIIAGFIASKIVNKQGEGIIIDCVLGIVGSMVGGWIYTQFFGHGVEGSLIISLIVAVIGAVIVLMVYHAITGRRATY